MFLKSTILNIFRNPDILVFWRYFQDSEFLDGTSWLQKVFLESQGPWLSPRVETSKKCKQTAAPEWDQSWNSLTLG